MLQAVLIGWRILGCVFDQAGKLEQLIGAQPLQRPPLRALQLPEQSEELRVHRRR